MKRIDVEKLYVALDRRRRHEGLMWAAISDEIGSSSSALSRIGRGVTPTADVFVRTLDWLGCTDVSEFTIDV